MTEVILASASVIRAQMLRNAGVQIEVIAARVDEDALKAGLLAEGAGPKAVAEALAEAKAVKISRKTGGLVIGADSTLDLDGQLYDKPVDLADARRHLAQFRGKTHKLHSAAVIAKDGFPVWRHVATATMRVRDFSDAFLDRYVESEGEALLSSVGGYRLEGLGAQIFNAIDGDYFVILGLPLLQVLDFLRVRGVLPS